MGAIAIPKKKIDTANFAALFTGFGDTVKKKENVIVTFLLLVS